jgi:hypothetical protein
VDLLQAGYQFWHRGAIRAFDNAAGLKEEKPGIPPLVGDRFEG